jgi:cytoskeletal protein RodZ
MPLIIDDYEPSAYEKKRLERIKKNEEYLEKLGLDKFRGLKQTGGSKKKNTNTVSVAVKKKAVMTKSKKPVPRRRSGRLSSKSNSMAVVMLDLNQVDGLDKVVKQWDENDEDDDENDGDENQNQNKSTVVTRRISINPDEYKLSDRDRISLASAVEEGIVDEHYLSKFQEFLEYHDGISVQNVKNVMKQARKLASGDGIRYAVRLFCLPV